VRAVGSTLIFRPLEQTFHEFLFQHLTHTVSSAWIKSEQQRPRAERHVIATWYLELLDLMRRGAPDPDVPKTNAAQMTGSVRSLLALAYDVYTIAHTGKGILPKMVDRLRHPQQFQGAMFEIAMAAIAIRAGFDIAWINATSKHVEFAGTHALSNERVAFEAKSHHRDGVLGRPGRFDPSAAREKVMTHVRAAVAQAARDTPLIVFDDLNLPPTPHVGLGDTGWFRSMRSSFGKYGFDAEFGHSQLAAVIATNFAWHFDCEQAGADRFPPNEVLVLRRDGGPLTIRADVLQLLEMAAQQYGRVPGRLHERADVP
jgi:hypothetical protein